MGGGGSGLCVGEYLISPKDSVIFLCSLLYNPPLKFCWRLLIPPPFPLETMWSPENLRTPPTPPLWVMNKDWSLRVVNGLREKKKTFFSKVHHLPTFTKLLKCYILNILMRGLTTPIIPRWCTCIDIGNIQLIMMVVLMLTALLCLQNEWPQYRCSGPSRKTRGSRSSRSSRSSRPSW